MPLAEAKREYYVRRSHNRIVSPNESTQEKYPIGESTQKVIQYTTGPYDDRRVS